MSRAFAFFALSLAFLAFVLMMDAPTAPNECRATVARPCVVKFPPRTAEDRFEIDYLGNGAARLIVSVVPEGRDAK